METKFGPNDLPSLHVVTLFHSQSHHEKLLQWNESMVSKINDITITIIIRHDCWRSSTSVSFLLFRLTHLSSSKVVKPAD